jgi:hypothetical protein
VKKSTRPAAENGGLPRRKIFSAFYFAPAQFFLLKGKENFSASAFAPKARGGGASLWLAGKKFPFPFNSHFFARSPGMRGF